MWVELPKDYDPVTMKESSVQSGIRPCIILGNNNSLENSGIVQVLAVTSKISKGKHLPVHVLLPENTLKLPSVVMAEQIRTVSQENVRSYITTLDKETFSRIKSAVMLQLFGSVKN